ncbi:MAG: APC family permease [Dehalococcoidia bacterium]
MQSKAESAGLSRSLNIFEVSLGGMGMILGAGIYALLGPATAEAGNGLWVSFVLAATLAGVIGLCYAELASTYPVAAADYEYALQAYGRRPAFIVGSTMAVGNIIAAASVAVAFASYFTEFVSLPRALVALVALLTATLIASAGIKESVRLASVATLIEVGGLVFVIVVGVPSLPSLDAFNFNGGELGILAGASLVMFAFNGFSQIATLAEETNSSEVVPKAMLVAIVATTILYVLVALSALAVLGASRLAMADAPLADVATKAIGDRAGQALALIALFSTANTMLLHLIVGSRLMYGMARKRALPGALAQIHPRLRTPLWAIAVCFVLGSVFAATGEIDFVAGATSFAIFVGFASVCCSVVVLRRSRPEIPRPFRVPVSLRGVPLLPIGGLLLTVCLLLNLEERVLFVGAVMLAAGAIGALLQSTSVEVPEDSGDHIGGSPL